MPATRSASGPIEAPRWPAPMSVGAPISEMVCLLISLFTCLWHADGHGPQPSRAVDVGAAASEGGSSHRSQANHRRPCEKDIRKMQHRELPKFTGIGPPAPLRGRSHSAMHGQQAAAGLRRSLRIMQSQNQRQALPRRFGRDPRFPMHVRHDEREYALARLGTKLVDDVDRSKRTTPNIAICDDAPAGSRRSFSGKHPRDFVPAHLRGASARPNSRTPVRHDESARARFSSHVRFSPSASLQTVPLHARRRNAQEAFACHYSRLPLRNR